MGQAQIGFLDPLTIGVAGMPQQFSDADDPITNVRMSQVTFRAHEENTGVVYVQSEEDATTRRIPIYPGGEYTYAIRGGDWLQPSQFWFDTQTNGNIVQGAWSKSLG